MLFIGGDGSGGCLTDQCKYDGLLIGIVFGVIIGAILLCCICAGLVVFCRGRPLRTNTTFIKAAAYDDMLETDNKSIFQSGTWTSRYHQYRSWHGPHRLSLTFDVGEMKINGTGSDDVGTFKITGIYSTKTQRVGLTKTYRAGTGNPTQNLGHSVTIQLYWNPSNNQFEGKWYVQTKKYRGEGKFELKNPNQPKSNIDSKV
jgi:hypothetical protein